jgi:hypothetical protein
MTERILKIWYIKEADMLEVFWGDKSSPLTGTEDDRVLTDLDVEGNLQGFQVEGVTKLKDGVLKVRIPSLEEAEENAQKPQKSRP